MPKILSFGSLNIDFVYSVPHFVGAGETLASYSLQNFCGGKGLNQSVALARAGAEVFHAGAVGSDGGALVSILEESGADASLVKMRDTRTGHAIIQKDCGGQNCILLYGGANLTITRDEIDAAISQFSAGDYVLLQNEINMVGEIMTAAKSAGMKVVFNPSPMNETVLTYTLDLVDIFLLNEVEARQICGEASITALAKRFNRAQIVLTLGGEGAKYISPDMSEPIFVPAHKVEVVDTTAAGDTFTGYFLAQIAMNSDAKRALEIAAAAAAIAVTRNGAAPSIPMLSEVRI